MEWAPQRLLVILGTAASGIRCPILPSTRWIRALTARFASGLTRTLSLPVPALNGRPRLGGMRGMLDLPALKPTGRPPMAAVAHDSDAVGGLGVGRFKVTGLQPRPALGPSRAPWRSAAPKPEDA
jgi:hypothetical protein